RIAHALQADLHLIGADDAAFNDAAGGEIAYADNIALSAILQRFPLHRHGHRTRSREQNQLLTPVDKAWGGEQSGREDLAGVDRPTRLQAEQLLRIRVPPPSQIGWISTLAP